MKPYDNCSKMLIYMKYNNTNHLPEMETSIHEVLAENKYISTTKNYENSTILVRNLQPYIDTVKTHQYNEKMLKINLRNYTQSNHY